MKSRLVVLLMAVTALLFLSSAVLAQATAPYFNYYGTFNYYADTNELAITISNIGMVAHDDGSFAFDPGTDPILGGHITLSALYNGDGAGENWSFAPDSGSSPDFVLYDFYSNQRLIAEIYDFTVVQNGSLFEVNVNLDQDNIGTIITDTNSPYSEFIDDVNSFSPPWGNLYMKFNFSGGGATDFTETQFGTVSGAFSVVPEPVSAILFVTGGAALAFRRRIRNRRHLKK